jgi:hypothetical protein
MLGSMLFVGVGGSGGNTVRAIREILSERLEAMKWEGPFPECWQTLWIDTIATQGRGGFPSPLLPSDSYLGLVPGQVSYQTVKEQIINATPASSRNEVLSGWLPLSTPVPIAKGAGQFRAIGRTVGVSQLGAMNRFLSEAHNRLTSAQANKDLARLNQLFDIPVSAKPPHTSVFVISSMAGGSGSGLFQDVAQLIKSVDPSLDEFMHVMLYGADVFALNVPENMLKSVPGNTLGALSEVVNGVWREKLTSASSFLFDGVGRPPISRRYGGKHHWLIGAKNNDGALGATTKEIYYAVGSSLASLTTSPATQQWLDDYVVVNVFPTSATMTDKTRLKVAGSLDHYQPFAAMGFSRISLGMDRFVDYAAECIARNAVEKLLWPDFEPVSKDQSMNRNVQIDTRTEQLWSGFLEDSGLRERNPDNDVLDALKGQESFYTNFANECIAHAAGRDSALDPSTWEQRIMNYFNANRVKLLTAEKPAIFESVQQWTQDIQKRVLAATSGVVVSGGLYVAIELLKKLRKELEFLIKTELPADAEQKRNLTDEIRGRVLKFLSTGKAKIEKKDQEIQKVQDTVKKGIAFLGEVDRIMIAIELLADLDENFLAPLLKSMTDEIENLKVEKASEDEYDFASFSSFPNSDKASVQERFAPPNTEQTLIDYKEFPKLLREWSQAALEPEHQGAWELRMTERALLGIPFDKSGDGSEQRLIETRPSWQPKNSNYRASIGNAQKAGFTVHATIGDIYERAKAMINSHAGSLSNQVNMGIRPYLDNLADPAEKSKRQKDFEAKFSSALKYSKPMVEENIKVLNAVHPGAAGGTYTSFSTIPLENLPLQEKVFGLVNQFDPENPAIQDKETFNSSESIREITIFSTTKGARNPVVFNTLMEPIYRDWIARANSSQTRQQFWTLRRTKPAPEAIPVAQEVLDQMFLGWLALTFADLRKVDDTDLNKGRKVSVYSYREKKWVDFPHPLLGLGDAPRSFDTFPAVLNSLAIALLEVNITASIAPLLAHHSLMDAGTDLDDDQEYGVNRVLLDYVQGTGPIKGDGDQTPEQRQATLVEDIQLEITSLKERFEEADRTPNPFEMTPQYEWREIWLKSLEKLLGHAQAIGSAGKRKKTRD